MKRRRQPLLNLLLLLPLHPAHPAHPAHAKIAPQSLQLVSPANTTSTKLVVNPEALEYLRSLPANSAVLPTTIIGPYRTGKSFTLNQIMDVPCSTGFGVGHTRQTQTKGIWVWKSSSSEFSPLLFVDTEGFESTGSSTAYDDRIFALATILSHTLIYNLPEAVRETDLEKLSFSSQLARAFGSEVSLHMVWLIQRDFLLGDNIDSFLEPTGLSPKTDEIRDGIRLMSETNHVIGLPQPHLNRTALCDIDEAEYDRRYLDARDKLRRLVKEDLPSRVLKKDMDGPGLADMIEETVEALNERDFPTSSSLVSYFNKDLVERLAKEYEASIESAVALPGDVGRIEAASAELADGIRTQFMENKFGADVGPSLASLEALTASTLSSFLEKNELASAKVCERIELDCERVMEREASQPIPSKGKFRKRYKECTERFRQACVGPAKHRNQERLEHAWEREVARFDKEFNDRLLNGVVFLTIAWVVVFRFVVRVAIAETIGWIAFVFLQVYPRTFIGSGTSVYETDWWQGLVKAWEAVVDNGLVDPDVLMYIVASVLAVYYFRAPLLRCCYCCCRVRIRHSKTHETKDLDV